MAGRRIMVYNIYCDESCHLEHDDIPVMVLGAVTCPMEKSREIAERLREIKVKHNLNPSFELKWTKVSPGKQMYYLDVLDYFFDDDDLSFRALVIPDKTKLNHESFQQSHDVWYYKMLYVMLNPILEPTERYRIYIDIKDTRSANRMSKLHDVLCSSTRDFDRSILDRVQTVRSHEIEQLQLTDLLIGAVGYVNRELSGNSAKISFIERMKKRSHYSLTQSTLYREQKTNIFIWEPRSGK
jgi:hypothetical protein